MEDILKGREILFEFRPVGNAMKVSAMDVATLTEISVQCPLGSGEASFKLNALRRLEYVLKKKGLID